MISRNRKEENLNCKASSKKSRFVLIDFLKFIFSIYVAVLHYYAFKLGGVYRYALAYVIVEFFLIILGFFIFKRYEKYPSIGDELKEYSIGFYIIKSKFNNIYIPFFISYIILFIIMEYVNNTPFLFYFKDFIKNLYEPMLLPMVGIGNINFHVPGWYVSALFISLLLILPFIECLGVKKVLSFSPIICLLIYSYFYNVFGHGDVWYQKVYLFLPTGLLRAIAGIMLGGVVYIVYNHIVNSDFLNKISLKYIRVFVMLGWFLLVFNLDRKNAARTDFICIPFYLIFIPLTFYHDSKTVYTELINKTSSYLAKLSLYIYLFHFIITRIYTMKLLENHNFLGIESYIIVVIIFSSFMMFILEKVKFSMLKHYKLYSLNM